MIDLGKQHNPYLNKNLIKSYFSHKKNLDTILKETDELFSRYPENMVWHSIKKQPYSAYAVFKNPLNVIAKKILSEGVRDIEAPSNTYVNEEGLAYPEWKTKLNQEYMHLLEKTTKQVNVRDFGAAGDGKTDDTSAFIRAIGSGMVSVFVPKGIYVTKGITLPSWTRFYGEGKGKTIIKLHDSAPKGTRLVTNSNHILGNCNISVESMSLDWNIERLGSDAKTSTWGNHSSCLTYAHVTYGWVRQVEGINPGLHCFDISSTFYNYFGDGMRARGKSEFIWLDGLNGYGFGDDGITTHHSRNILITNSHMCDPSGRSHQTGFSNSNGFEVDDGSRDVWLIHNSSARCFGGVEIKAHATSSAASNTQIIGHLSVHDNRSFNFRHIGHHKDTDPESLTAYNIKASNLVAIAPVYTELYKESAPRALVISAYSNVVINHFMAIGDTEYNYQGQPIIAVQYKSRNVTLSNVTVKDFSHAETDIKIFGGSQPADYIFLTNITCQESSPEAVYVGKEVQNISVRGLRAERSGGKYAIHTAKDDLDIHGVQARGYKSPISIAKNSSKEILAYD
ncbi:glycosyl hydrolase family 28-related protein [Bacillus massiliglaciei]|uniref:glycosyl hydrolase family 28-related protein n=1 Tax=Bacillus massiliglaciei TaxID=1816693 RepID=UPI000AED12A3|nr:glycosyl hydrolase family 28-related protein [Bacillus massiliglaciei]